MSGDLSPTLGEDATNDLKFLRSHGFASRAEYEAADRESWEQAQRIAKLVYGLLSPDVAAIRDLLDELVPHVTQLASNQEAKMRRSRRVARVSAFRVIEGGRPPA